MELASGAVKGGEERRVGSLPRLGLRRVRRRKLLRLRPDRILQETRWG